MMFAGTGTLIRLILRRDRAKLPIWLFAVVLSLVAMVPLLQNVYGDAASIMVMYQTFSANPAGIFLTGPMDAPTFGAFMTIETTLWWGLAIAFMNTLFIIRHTRQNEEMGAQELVLSGRAHRGSALASALIVAFLVNAVMAALIAIGLIVVQAPLDGADVWLYGAAFGAFGMVWACIAAVVAQFVQSARSANGVLASLIGLAFLLRGVGDFLGHADEQGVIQAEWPSLLSPFGWLQSTRALTFPDWSPLIITMVASILFSLLAFWLLSMRDVGSGILPPRRGRSRASNFLRTPFGLTWKLQKNVLIGWGMSIVTMAATIGALVPAMGGVYEESEQMRHLIEAMGGTGAIIPSFLAAMLAMMVLMVLAYVLQALGRLRNEEVNGHVEQLLATRFSRLKWLSLHSLVVLGGSIILLSLAGGVMALVVSLASDMSLSVSEYVLASLSYMPVVLVFVGLYIALFGLMPRTAGLVGWIYFGYVTFALWVAPMLGLNEWITDLSLLSHVAAVPVEPVIWCPLIVFCAIGVVLAAGGVIAFKRRDTSF